ncbi:unnamed protein product [Dovyalis caffra]|uniref:Uncharacterized protein n=1 Tax=Dovyalis caffra TaxID=77055 RepID=A0AAV1QUS6_9ROSI|nr:unnamed protein product [Dovyalis caffra]
MVLVLRTVNGFRFWPLGTSEPHEFTGVEHVLQAHRDVGRGSLKKRRPSCRLRDLHRVGG